MNKKQQFTEKLNALNMAWQELNSFVIDNDEFKDSFAQDYPFSFCFNEYAGDVDKWVKSATDHPATFKPSINQSVNFDQLLKLDWSKYDETEVHPVAGLDKEEKVLPWEMLDIANNMEQVDETDLITCYSVYVHLIGGGIDCIGDFKYEEEAKMFESFIRKTFLKHVGKHVNLTFSCTIGQNANVDSLRENLANAIEYSDNCMSVIQNFDIYEHEKR